jgi:hypothetical protein
MSDVEGGFCILRNVGSVCTDNAASQPSSGVSGRLGPVIIRVFMDNYGFSYHIGRFEFIRIKTHFCYTIVGKQGRKIPGHDFRGACCTDSNALLPIERAYSDLLRSNLRIRVCENREVRRVGNCLPQAGNRAGLLPIRTPPFRRPFR